MCSYKATLVTMRMLDFLMYRSNMSKQILEHQSQHCQPDNAHAMNVNTDILP